MISFFDSSVAWFGRRAEQAVACVPGDDRETFPALTVFLLSVRSHWKGSTHILGWGRMRQTRRVLQAACLLAAILALSLGVAQGADDDSVDTPLRSCPWQHAKEHAAAHPSTLLTSLPLSLSTVSLGCAASLCHTG
jgi:hypothetical protein